MTRLWYALLSPRMAEAAVVIGLLAVVVGVIRRAR